jgi:hypothetical protein
MSRAAPPPREGFISSRPYRIAVDLTSDFEDVRSLVRRGSLRACSRCLPGPVLPGSTSPGIVEIREDFRAELRQALLQTSRVDPLFAFAQTPEGWDDVELWERCLALLRARRHAGQR